MAKRSRFFRLIQLLFLFVFLSACETTPPATLGLSATLPSPATPESNLPKAEVIIEAQVPSAFREDQNLYIEILDEVTGLALNAARIQMSTTDRVNFNLRLPVTAGSALKYRYVRDQDPIGLEYNSRGQQVRYRMLIVQGPMTVKDTITGWRSEERAEKLGRIIGQVSAKNNNAPVVNALVLAGGLQTITASDGSFILEGLPEGLHNLVIYSMDGIFKPFQQGALVAPDSTTPASVQVEPSKMVTVTFVVTQPDPNLNGVPMRMAGSTYALGNTFSDLRGGMSVSAARAPTLKMLPDGRYSIILKLPAGLDLRYKYTLGDGFWNAERYKSGGLRLRQLIVPNQDIIVEEQVELWNTPGLAPVTFTIQVPENTPVTDMISIQINPFSWTEPIPMWPLGGNRWFYLLYSPLDAFTTASYRFCRNDQCGTADASGSQGSSAVGTPFAPQETPLEIEAEVAEWAWSQDLAAPMVVSDAEVNARAPDFWAGVAFVPGYHPSWQPYLPAAFRGIKEIGANTVIITPTWRLTSQNPPVMEPLPGRDALWPDLAETTVLAQQRGLGVVIHPKLVLPQQPDAWWQAARRDNGWWQSWFDRYQTFLVHHADLANQSGAQALVIGDENLLPALPGGVLADGSPSNVPDNAEERWIRLIAAVRSRYSGKLVWMVTYSGGSAQPATAPAEMFDLVYIELSPPFTSSDEVSQAELEERFAAILDDELLQFQEQANQPVIIGLRYPSIQGALDGCAGSGAECLPDSVLYGPVPAIGNVDISLQQQADAYSALLAVVNERSWIGGFISAGYYPPVDLKDASTSTRSKPAGNVLWYWYPRLLGKVAP